MLGAAIEQAGSLGFKEVRLITANPHARRLFEATGFRQLVAPRRWQALRIEGGEGARLPGPADASRLAAALAQGPVLAGYGGVIPDGEWALEPEPALLGRLAADGLLRVAAGGRALAYVRPGWAGDQLWAPFIVGSGAPLRDLAMALRFEADTLGMSGVSVWAYDGHPAEIDLRETGYDSETEPFRLHYYALRLDS